MANRKYGQNCGRALEQGMIGGINGVLKKPVHKVAVVIPIYQSEFNQYEKISLDRCFHVLSQHPIIVIKPAQLDVSYLIGKGYEFQTLDFPDECFKSVESYNQMLLSRCFYESFLDFKYILIYQTDAFVFRDDLLKWCETGFDYIGAPWLGETWPLLPRTKLEKLLSRTRFTHSLLKPKIVGNGGFSLRKIRSSIIARMLLSGLAEKYHVNEDVYWSLDVPRRLPFFKVPDFKVAVDFSFELEPRNAMKLNNERLPFGCHAWEKWDMDFWRPYFRELGYEI